MYQWIVFAHILCAIVFFMAHGASAVMAFQLRRERKVERIRAILDLSSAALPTAYFGIAGLMGNWFSQGWIWASIVLMVVLWGAMVAYAARFYAPIRKAVGLPERSRGDDQVEGTPASEAEIVRLIQASNPILLGGISLGLIAVILWLMMFKPF